jgi:DNA polymerase III alpha subunit
MLTNIEQTEKQLVEGVLRHGPSILKNCVVGDSTDLSKYIDKISQDLLDYPIPKNTFNSENWFIPSNYKNLDVEEFLVNQCPVENYDRLVTELELYRKFGMIPVLKTMKYIVDTLRQHNIVWGVGRGSSVSSYVLYLLGVHKIDSVKYNLPIDEFFKGEING